MRTKLASFTIVLAGLVGNAALADIYCRVPMVDWRPIEELVVHLETQGWAVEKAKIDDGCYEAYAIDPNGRFVEAYFNPQTFEMVKLEVEEDDD